MQVYCAADTVREPNFSKSLWIFDYDDCMSSGVTVDRALKKFLQELRSTGVHMAVTSFNNYAVQILQNNNIVDLFDIIVFGWPDRFAGKSESLDCVFRRLNWDPNRHGPVYYFDDQADNVAEVMSVFPSINCFQVSGPDDLLCKLRVCHGASPAPDAPPDTDEEGPVPEDEFLLSSAALGIGGKSQGASDVPDAVACRLLRKPVCIEVQPMPRSPPTPQHLSPPSTQSPPSSPLRSRRGGPGLGLAIPVGRT